MGSARQPSPRVGRDKTVRLTFPPDRVVSRPVRSTAPPRSLDTTCRRTAPCAGRVGRHTPRRCPSGKPGHRWTDVPVGWGGGNRRRHRLHGLVDCPPGSAQSVAPRANIWPNMHGRCARSASRRPADRVAGQSRARRSNQREFSLILGRAHTSRNLRPAATRSRDRSPCPPLPPALQPQTA